MNTAAQENRVSGTSLGLLAIVLWSAAHSLMRLMAEAFGPIAGAALLYSAGTLMLLASIGWTPLRKFPPKYLLVGGTFFIAYEISLALALGLAESRRQVIEVSLINYLWPCLAAALAVCFGRQRAGWTLPPGLIMSMLGITWILNGPDGFSLIGLYENIQGNPLSYSLAISAACLWALYCFFARGLAQGTDAIVPFFAGTSLVLWVKFALSDDPLPVFTMHKVILLAFTALVLAMGHAAWNKALRIGNLLILAAASYATPVLSSVLSSVILATPLGLSFWQGVAFVTAGSVLCWIATRRG